LYSLDHCDSAGHLGTWNGIIYSVRVFSADVVSTSYGA